MPSLPGLAASEVLATVAMPERVAVALAAEFRDQMAANRHLSGPLRVQLLTARPATKRPPAWEAEQLCTHPFTADEAVAVADTERRKAPLLRLVGSAGDDALLVLLEHPNRLVSAAAMERLGTRQFPEMPVEELVARRDRFTGVHRLRVLFAAPPELIPVAELAESLVALPETESLHVLAGAQLLERLFIFRPGLIDELAGRRHLPQFLYRGAAISPHLRPGTAAALFAPGGQSPGPWRDLAGMNPWATGELTAAPSAVDPAGLERAWQFYESLGSLHHEAKTAMFAAFAANPHLDWGRRRRFGTTAAEAVQQLAGCDGLPEWVSAPLLAAYRDAHPHDEVDLDRRRTDVPAQGAVKRPAKAMYPILERSVASVVNAAELKAVAPLLPVLLGDDIDAWRTVITLIDTFDGPLLELVEVARGVTSPNT